MVLPERIQYDSENYSYRAKQANPSIAKIYSQAHVSAEIKKRNSASVLQNSARVAATGIEPVFRV